MGLDNLKHEDSIPIHNACGLPIELCICEDAKIKYDWDRDCFVVESDDSREEFYGKARDVLLFLRSRKDE